MTETVIDPVFNLTRLGVCAFLSGCEEADYAAVQDYCGLTKPTLSKSLTLLDERGYVLIRKVPDGRYVKTTLRLTDVGRNALSGHLDALRRIADEAARAGAANSPRARNLPVATHVPGIATI